MESIRNLSNLKATEIVFNVLSDLSKYVRNESSQNSGIFGMGATVVLCLIRGNQALFAHMGDSRAYLLREKHLERLTTDHSVVQLLIEAGKIAPEEVATHPARAQITRYIGMKDEALPELRVINLVPGDCLLLCTDGLTNMLDSQTITKVLCTHPDLESACHALVDAANEAGGKDNITVIVVNCL